MRGLVIPSIFLGAAPRALLHSGQIMTNPCAALVFLVVIDESAPSFIVGAVLVRLGPRSAAFLLDGLVPILRLKNDGLVGFHL